MIRIKFHKNKFIAKYQAREMRETISTIKKNKLFDKRFDIGLSSSLIIYTDGTATIYNQNEETTFKMRLEK